MPGACASPDGVYIHGMGRGQATTREQFGEVFGERRGRRGGHEPFSSDTNAFFVSLDNAIARRILALLRWWSSDPTAEHTTIDALAGSSGYQGLANPLARARADFEWLARQGILKDTRHSGQGVSVFVPPPLSESQEPNTVPFLMRDMGQWPERYRTAFAAWLDA
jgi:hypothetical protein